MKIQDAVVQIAKVLPTLTDKFSDFVTIKSMTRTLLVVNVETNTAHGLTNGQKVVITGVRVKNKIYSLTRSGVMATMVTVDNNDQTEQWPKSFEIVGVTETGWNGVYNNTSVPSGNIVVFTVGGSLTTPATITSAYMIETMPGYNGTYVVSVIDDTHFTYTLLSTPRGLPEFASAKCVTKIRIAGADSKERLIQYYSKQVPDKWWGVVIMGDNATSKDRSVKTDATYEYNKGAGFEVVVMQEFSLYVIVPYGSSYVTARPQRDDIEDLRAKVYKSILGFFFDSGLSVQQRYGVVPTKEAMFDEPNGAFFVYEFGFQYQFTVIGGRDIDDNGDIASIDENVAMRSFDITLLDNDGTNDLTLRQIKGSVPV